MLLLSSFDSSFSHKYGTCKVNIEGIEDYQLPTPNENCEFTLESDEENGEESLCATDDESCSSDEDDF